MKRQIKPFTAIALCALLIFSTTAFDCKKGTPEEQKAEFIAYAKDINQAFVSAGPLIAQLKPNLKPIWDKGTNLTSRLIVAVEASDKVVVSEILVELIPLFTSVAAEFTDNTKVLVILVLADIGLKFFANHYKGDITGSGASGQGAAGSVGRARVIAYANRKPWRCRDSKTGRYAKMALCQSSPETTTVETR